MHLEKDALEEAEGRQREGHENKFYKCEGIDINLKTQGYNNLRQFT